MVDKQNARLKVTTPRKAAPDKVTRAPQQISKGGPDPSRDQVAGLTKAFENSLQELKAADADLNDISLSTVSLLLFNCKFQGAGANRLAARLKQWKDIFDKIAHNKTPEADALKDLMTRSGVTQELQPLLKSMIPVAAAVGNPIDYDRFITFCVFVEIFSTCRDLASSSASTTTAA